MRLRKFTRITSNMVILVAFANGLVFFVLSVLLGGTAFNGEYAGDKYFLGASGTLTQVSSAVYYYSFWHGISVVLLILCAITFTGINHWLWQRSSDAKDRIAGTESILFRYVVLVLAIGFLISLIFMMIYGALK